MTALVSQGWGGKVSIPSNLHQQRVLGYPQSPWKSDEGDTSHLRFLKFSRRYLTGLDACLKRTEYLNLIVLYSESAIFSCRNSPGPLQSEDIQPCNLLIDFFIYFWMTTSTAENQICKHSESAFVPAGSRRTGRTVLLQTWGHPCCSWRLCWTSSFRCKRS